MQTPVSASASLNFSDLGFDRVTSDRGFDHALSVLDQLIQSRSSVNENTVEIVLLRAVRYGLKKQVDVELGVKTEIASLRMELEKRLTVFGAGGLESSSRLLAMQEMAQKQNQIQARLESLTRENTLDVNSQSRQDNIEARIAKLETRIMIQSDPKVAELENNMSRLNTQLDDAWKTWSGQLEEVRKANEASAKVEDTLLPLTSNVLDDVVQEYELQESMWDGSIMIGMSGLGVWSALQLALGVIVNMAIELVFCLVVFANMANKSVDDDTIASARHWRGVVGHDITYADEAAHTSLVSRLCGGDTALPYSAQQYILNDNLAMFLDPGREGLLGELNGQVLALISLIVWIWSLLGDILHNLEFAVAVLMQNYAGMMPKVEADDEGVYVRSFGFVQLIAVIFFSVVPRLGITLFLSFVGFRFLAFTTELGDLLLNAMALTFVLDIDELVFGMMAPLRAKQFLRRMRPLQIGKCPKLLQGGHVFVWMRTVITFCLLYWVNIKMVEPSMEIMQQVTHYLCDGDRDFVATTNKASGVLVYTETSAFSQTYQDLYMKTAVLNHAFRDEGRREISSKVPQWEAVSRIKSSSVDFSSNLLLCLDHLNSVSEVNREYGNDTLYWAMFAKIADLSGWVGNATQYSCSNVTWEQCIDPHGSYYRAACAPRCGCSNPWLGNMFATQMYGCPSQCAQLFNFYLRASSWDPSTRDGFRADPGFQPWYYNASLTPSLSECQDPDASIIKYDTGWNRYIIAAGLAVEAKGYSREAANRVMSVLRQSGCSGHSEIKTQLDFSVRDTGGIGQTFCKFCPRSCECNALTAIEKTCPTQCLSYKTTPLETLIDPIATRIAGEVTTRTLWENLAQYMPTTTTPAPSWGWGGGGGGKR